MHKSSRTIFGAARSVTILLMLLTGYTAVHAQPGNSRKTAIAAPATTETDSANTQEQLITLLRLSPTLTEVVQRDPSLLANQDYVSRTNPELAQFLQLHPEITRNPDFYLFSRLDRNGRRSRFSLDRRVWPELSRPEDSAGRDVAHALVPVFIVGSLIFAFLWLIHAFLQNRRWNRVLRLQSDTHGKLIDRLGNSQELLAYMGTDAGKRFLEAAPISMDFDLEHRLPGTLSRVLAPLQVGVVLTLLGFGLLLLRHNLPDLASPFLVFGVIVLMPGLGFILSAGITWLLAARLGLIPNSATSPAHLKDRP
jgi:hypothetical protein